MKEIHIDSLPKSFDKALFIKENLNPELGIGFCFSYSSIFSNTKILRHFTEMICNELNLAGKWKSRLALIVDELNNNAIEYGSKPGENNYFRVKVIKKSSKVSFIIEVEDTGNGTHHRTSKEMEKLQEQKLKKGFIGYNSIRGRGLFMIIHDLVDKLYFKDSSNGGLIVGVKKELHF